MTESTPTPMVPWDMFLVYMTAYGQQGADNALVWEVLDELGLSERNAFTGDEMLAIEKAVAARVETKLAASWDAMAPGLLSMLSAANRMVERHSAAR